MTYAEAVALRAELEAALLSGTSLATVQVGDRVTTYKTMGEMKNALNMLNRDIRAYERRASNINPTVVRPRWH